MDICILRCPCWQPEGQEEGRGQCLGRRWGSPALAGFGVGLLMGESEAGSGLCNRVTEEGSP